MLTSLPKMDWHEEKTFEFYIFAFCSLLITILNWNCCFLYRRWNYALRVISNNCPKYDCHFLMLAEWKVWQFHILKIWDDSWWQWFILRPLRCSHFLTGVDTELSALQSRLVFHLELKSRHPFWVLSHISLKLKVFSTHVSSRISLKLKFFSTHVSSQAQDGTLIRRYLVFNNYFIIF